MSYNSSNSLLLYAIVYVVSHFDISSVIPTVIKILINSFIFGRVLLIIVISLKNIFNNVVIKNTIKVDINPPKNSSINRDSGSLCLSKL